MPAILRLPTPHESIRESLQRGEGELKKLFSQRTTLAPRATFGRSGRPKIGRIRSGWAMRVRYMSDGQAACSAILLPGDLIGAETALFGSQADEIVALTACEIDCTDPEPVWDAMRNSPDLSARLMWQVCEDAQRLRRWVVAMGRGSADQRAALLLLDLRARLWKYDGVDPLQTTIPLPLTQAAMADALGLTAVHVNRVLKRLREAGLAVIKGAKATLAPALLAELAAPLLDESPSRPNGAAIREVHLSL